MAYCRTFKSQVSWTKLVSGEIQQRCFHSSPAVFGASKVAMSKLDTKPLPYDTLEKRIKIVADRKNKILVSGHIKNKKINDGQARSDDFSLSIFTVKLIYCQKFLV
ncbi:hypothetical protein ACI65C_010623 [Semiaphis heraclei]